jgi:hypothetical protein
LTRCSLRTLSLRDVGRYNHYKVNAMVFTGSSECNGFYWKQLHLHVHVHVHVLEN